MHKIKSYNAFQELFLATGFKSYLKVRFINDVLHNRPLITNKNN